MSSGPKPFFPFPQRRYGQAGPDTARTTGPTPMELGTTEK
jgi:hypothetical protein